MELTRMQSNHQQNQAVEITVDDCAELVKALGVAARHYEQQLRTCESLREVLEMELSAVRRLQEAFQSKRPTVQVALKLDDVFSDFGTEG